jgi:integrase
MTKDELISKLEEWILEQKLQEYAPSTLNQYKANVLKFINWLPEDAVLNKETMLEYKAYLGEIAGSTNSINVWIVTINKFLKWLDLKDLTIKKIKMQSKQSNEEVLSVADYKRLLRFAKRQGKHQLYYIMKILAMTGIRISELRFFKVENLKSNYIDAFNKGKERTIIVRQDLMRELKKYAKEQGIKEGFLFPSAFVDGKMVNPSTIWRQMKAVAGQARVRKSKVHAHSFRHLFAQVFLNTYSNNITELADILGHNSLDTTRLYTRTSDAQKRQKLEGMRFENDEK